MNGILKKQDGIALVISLMLLLVMSVMVAGFMLTVTSERKLGSNQKLYMEAMNIAEAGISEVAARIAMGPSDPSGYYIGEGSAPTSALWSTKVINSSSLPSAATGSHVTYVTSLQPTTSRLPYSVSSWSGSDTTYCLTVAYKTNSAKTGIYYYNHATGKDTLIIGPTYSAPNDNYSPVYVARSTGIMNNIRRTIEVHLTQQKYTFSTTAAVACDGGVFRTGYFAVCGHNHSINTPWGTEPYDAAHGGSYPCESYELCDRTAASDLEAGCLPGVSTTGDIIQDPGQGNNGGIWGSPDPTNTNAPSPFKPIWEVFGYATEEEFTQAFNFRTVTSYADADFQDGNGFIKFDMDEVDADNFGVSQVQGIWWIKGGFKMSGDFQFKGLIYVDGNFEKNQGGTGKCWILGSLMCNGEVVGTDPNSKGVHFRGNGDVLYSSEAVVQQLQNSSNIGLKQLSWREINL